MSFMRRILLIILLSASIPLCCGFVSTNVPLDHWSYDAIDRLIGHELIKSSMMSTKPITRLEMARLITEASENLEKLSQKNKINLTILERLKKEFRSELFATGLLDGHYFGTFIKPVEDPYVRYIFADKQPTLENQRGDTFNRQSNYRAGFATRIQLFQTAAFYLHPEYQDSSSNHNGEIELIEAYGKVAFDNIEVKVWLLSVFFFSLKY